MTEQLRPHTREAREAWYDRLAKDEPDTTDFLIYERVTIRPIGKTALDQIDHVARIASLGIIIGERDCWGKGYGTETAILMLDYRFTLLGLHNIMLTVDSYNERAIRAYRRAGFKEIGHRREARRRGGRAYDVISMDCLATEFRSPLLHRLLPNEAVSSSGPVAGGIGSQDPAVQIHDDDPKVGNDARADR
jgi:RimJ/RimL family protein N-acetyltransferase